jgi:long-chain fatty acid transport protein
MKKLSYILTLLFVPMILLAQTGHILQGIGAFNMSMGGAATGQPLDINGALHWNPAGISAFTSNTFSVNAGFFLSSPELSSSVPTPNGTFSGTTKDDRGMSVMPALAMVWAKPDGKHSFGLSAFGISGFGVTFPENMSNPINMPQSMGGFGRIESDYQLLQVGLTYAYEINEKLSVGIAPTFNYAMLELAPNPLSSPSPQKGYPVSDKASAPGFGAQAGIFYNSGSGFKLGLSYKTQQYFSEFKFNNTYLDGTAAPEVSFTMNYPSIFSAGLGYSKKQFDIALDYRMVNYSSTEGFEAKGWTQTASVQGFGWENISVVSAGIQYKGIEKLPIRLGYTYSSNPISSELAFFSTPATAVIKNAFQAGLSYHINNKFRLDAAYHHGTSSGSTSGPLLNPMMVTPVNPYGAIPGTEVSYNMTTDLFLIGFQYSFGK